MIRAVFAAALLLALLPPPVGAQAGCTFQLGFKAIADQIPGMVGQCLENERFNTSNGNAEQRTTAHHGKGGLLVWRKADNWTAFTDGHWTWINGPFGVRRRLNTERFVWEPDGFTWTGPRARIADEDRRACAALPGTATGALAAACFSVYVGDEPSRARPSPQPPAASAPAPPRTAGSLTLADIDGRAILVADDGTYLGRISSNPFDAESICNTFGEYGNPFGQGIRNDFAPYGNPFSPLSVRNEFTTTPPMILYEGRVIGYVTKNRTLPGAVDPDVLFAAYDCRD